ncbi:MAG: phosphate acetyltransferase [Candidatus Cloacimonetes bacterium]|nr:phosphate acetyltransferase [Candidatus Cloacimonadota bacterium]
MNILKDFWEKAKLINGKVILPESGDKRTLIATEMILKEKLCGVVLVGEKEAVLKNAAHNGVNIDGAEIIMPEEHPRFDDFAEFLYERRKEKGLTREKAIELSKNELYFGALMVQFKEVNGMVAGAANTTGDVLRSALQVVGVAKGLKTVSSSFIMVVPQGTEEVVYLFGDCAVVPDPTSEQLADIAMSTALTRKQLLGDQPKVALLSFSTKGSAKHELVDKVIRAREILEERKADFEFDGELQLDAAIVPKVAKSKAPGSSVAGQANVLIFPDLQSGNIGYKLTQRLAGAEAIGPVIQGLAAPICDLSRGCSAEDIANTATLVLLMSKA